MNDKQKRISVSQLNRYVAAVLEKQSVLSDLLVQGELSNVKNPSSGHWYFNLKDDKAQVSCVMFRSRARSLRFRPEDGQAVVVRARAALFERDGKFQLYVESMEPFGKGDLYLAFEQLNAKLKAEGLYDAAHKRPLPRFPRCIGVATSATGAVIRDIIHVSRRRFPACRLLLAPCSVQGPGSAESIIKAIELLNSRDEVDLIIVGRGGGSLEDLWSFNEEAVARAVYHSAKPIISAVGHETDFTICDFVADLRAPTPSAAAELALPDAATLYRSLTVAEKRMAEALQQKILLAGHRLARLADNPYLKNPYERLDERRMLLERLAEEMNRETETQLKRRSQNVQKLAASLDALSPLKVLARGYAMVTSEEQNRPETSVRSLHEGDKIRLHMSDGRLLCTVDEKEFYQDGAK